MKLLFVNACFIDQLLSTNEFERRKWHVHSKYKNSFNIQDEGKQQLVVITTTNYPFVPSGIYVEVNDFSQLLTTIRVGEEINWEQQCLHFSENHLVLMHGKQYSSVIEIAEKLLKTTQEKLFTFTNTLRKETGSQHALNQFLEGVHPFNEAVQQLCSENKSQQKIGIDFLLGRGMGLTPSGDDMMVGHLAARLLLKEESTKLTNLLLTELLSERSLTTDVSKHYLLCGLSKRFSEPVIDLVNTLTTNSSKEQIEETVEAVIKVGHTSGVDLLAGFLTTIKFFSNK